MAELLIDSYGDAIADVYDELMAPVAAETAAAVEFLAGLCPGGRALELGVGTGRVAVPLAARGVRVHGIEASRQMLARLRDKPGGAAVGITVGDFAMVPVAGEFDLVYVVFNTLCALVSQDAQVACLDRAAGRLRPGGRLVVELFVPDRARFDRPGACPSGDPAGRPSGDRAGSPSAGPGGGWSGRPDGSAPRTGQVRLPATRHDPPSQTLTARQVLVTGAGRRVLPLRMRYVWPAELDLMARLAGLRREARFGGWGREPFTADSDSHVSVFAAPPDAPRGAPPDAAPPGGVPPVAGPVL